MHSFRVVCRLAQLSVDDGAAQTEVQMMEIESALRRVTQHANNTRGPAKTILPEGTPRVR